MGPDWIARLPKKQCCEKGGSFLRYGLILFNIYETAYFTFYEAGCFFVLAEPGSGNSKGVLKTVKRKEEPG